MVTKIHVYMSIATFTCLASPGCSDMACALLAVHLYRTASNLSYSYNFTKAMQSSLTFVVEVLTA